MLSPSTVAALLLSLLVSKASAQTPATPVYTLRPPSLLGSGCPLGTAHAEIAGDGQSISILFSEYAAATSGDVTRVRKSCNFVLPVDAVPGVSIGFYKVDFRGYAYVPQVPTAYGSLTNEFFFAGQPGPTMTKRFDAGADQSIFESTPINVQSVIWSPCGGSTNFRINSAAIAYKPNAGGEDVQIQIDSVDATVSGEVKVASSNNRITGAVGVDIRAYSSTHNGDADADNGQASGYNCRAGADHNYADSDYCDISPNAHSCTNHHDAYFNSDSSSNDSHASAHNTITITNYNPNNSNHHSTTDYYYPRTYIGNTPTSVGNPCPDDGYACPAVSFARNNVSDA